MKLSFLQNCFGWSISEIGAIELFLVLTVGFALLFAAGFYGYRWLKRRKRKHRGDEPILKFSAGLYDVPSLARTIEKLSGRPQTILLAANSISDLPVTVPVNLAIQMAKKGKCLLIDLDLSRNSVAKVFEIDDSKTDANFYVSSQPTSIDNLFIWPAGHFEKSRQMNLGVLLREAQKKYDYILLYAPYLTTLADRKQIAGCARQAFVFGSHAEKGDRLPALLKMFKCNILKPVQA